MMDILIAGGISVAMVTAPVWISAWLYYFVRDRSTEEATEGASSLLIGLGVSLFGGVAVFGSEMTMGLGVIGDLVAQFPHLVVYGLLSVGSSIGLTALTELSAGYSMLIGFGGVTLIIMFWEGSEDDDE